MENKTADTRTVAQQFLEELEKAVAKMTPAPWEEECGILKHYVHSTESQDFGISLQELHWEDGHVIPAHENAAGIVALRNGFDRLLSLAKEKQGWIACEEKLPETKPGEWSEYVETYSPFWEIPIRIQCFKAPECALPGRWSSSLASVPTHWRTLSLPAPPSLSESAVKGQ